MPAHLSDIDKLGIHRHLLHVDLICRFSAERGEDKQEQMRTLLFAATLHALRAAGRDLGRLTREEYQRLLDDLEAWERDRLGPSVERLLTAAKAGLSREQVLRAQVEYEPALTDWGLTSARGWTDFEGNRQALRSALRLVEERGVLPDEAKNCKVPECSDADVLRVLEILTADKPDRHLFHTTAKGKFRLGETEVRDGFENESIVGAVEPVRKRYGRPSADGEIHEVAGIAEGFDLRDPRALDPTKDPENEDLAAAISIALEYRAAREDAGSPDWIAAKHYQDVAHGLTTVPALAGRFGVDERTLQRAFERVRMEMCSKFEP